MYSEKERRIYASFVVTKRSNQLLLLSISQFRYFVIIHYVKQANYEIRITQIRKFFSL